MDSGRDGMVAGGVKSAGKGRVQENTAHRNRSVKTDPEFDRRSLKEI